MTKAEEPMARSSDDSPRPRVLDMVKALAPLPVDGGPVALALGDLLLPHLVACCCGGDWPALRVRRAAGFTPPWLILGDEVIVAKERHDGWRVEMQPATHGIDELLRMIGAGLADLPDGAEVELATATSDAPAEDGLDDAGWHRCRGLVQKGQWLIGEYYPPIDGATLQEMFQLAREMDAIACGQGAAINCLDDIEAATIVELAAGDEATTAMKLTATGASIACVGASGEDIMALATLIFHHRYGGLWPMSYGGVEDDEGFEDDAFADDEE